MLLPSIFGNGFLSDGFDDDFDDFMTWPNESRMMKPLYGKNAARMMKTDVRDVDGNYEPSNCRWADINIQNRNRRKKENTIISECKNYLIGHNLSFNDKLYFVSNGVVIGYITKDKLTE